MLHDGRERFCVRTFAGYRWRLAEVLFLVGVADEFVGPLDEVLHVGRVCVAAVVLAPGELAIEQSLVYRRHGCGAVVSVDIKSRGAEQSEDADLRRRWP